MNKALRLTCLVFAGLLLHGCGDSSQNTNAGTSTTILSDIYFQQVTHIFPPNRDVYNIFTVKDDGSGITPLTSSPANQEFDNVEPAVSPDGTRIAFATTRHRVTNGNTTEIYVMNINGTNQIRLTTNVGIDDDGPRWCSNSRLLYSSNGSVMEMDAADLNGDGNGDNPMTIVAAGAGGNPYNYFVDCAETKIVFIRDPGSYIVMANRNGSNETYLGGGASITNGRPQFSPNGSHIAFNSNLSAPGTALMNVYTMDAADTNNDQQGDNLLRITTSTSGLGSVNPVWSPLGDYLAYSRDNSNGFEVRKMQLSSVTQSVVVPAPPNSFVGDWH